ALPGAGGGELVALPGVGRLRRSADLLDLLAGAFGLQWVLLAGPWARGLRATQQDTLPAAWRDHHHLLRSVGDCRHLPPGAPGTRPAGNDPRAFADRLATGGAVMQLVEAQRRIETVAVHAGVAVDVATGAVTPPLYLSTTFERAPDGDYPQGYTYARSDNP